MLTCDLFRLCCVPNLMNSTFSPDFFSTGQLCLDTGGDPLTVPVVLESENDPVSSDFVRSFKAGRQSTYILYDGGSVVACGLNDVGQLGDGTFNDSFGTAVPFPTSANDVVYVGSGPSAESVFYITEGGAAFGSGLNDKGQLGVGDIMNRNSPVLIQFPNSADIRDISASNTHTAAW